MLGALAALYLLWLATWIVLGPELYGASRYNWDQALAAAVTGLVGFIAARRVGAPYRGFLALQGIAFLCLAASWVTYPWSSEPSVAAAIPLQDPGIDRQLLIANAIYALFVFAALCAWGYLALERWRDRPLSTLTTMVFAVLMLGLGAIFAGFYSGQYAGQPDSPAGRLGAVTAALEFAVLVAGLFCMLLRLPVPAIWMLVGTVILIAGDMAFSIDVLPTTPRGGARRRQRRAGRATAPRREAGITRAAAPAGRPGAGRLRPKTRGATAGGGSTVAGTRGNTGVPSEAWPDTRPERHPACCVAAIPPPANAATPCRPPHRACDSVNLRAASPDACPPCWRRPCCIRRHPRRGAARLQHVFRTCS